MSTGEAKPNGAKMIEVGTEKEFIAPMPVHKLPSVGKETHRKLVLMGVRNIHTLSCIPPLLMEKSFGKNGIELWKKSHAIDERPVIPYHEKQSISTEKTFAEDTTDIDFITAQLSEMCSNLAYELRQSKKLTSCVTVKIRYTDFNTFSKQQKLPYTAIDHTLLSLAKNLFHQLYQRRQLIRLIGLRFSGLVHGNPQMSLFDQHGESEKLLQAMDHIRKKFGMKAITKAFLLDKP
jgi:DNA polymerase-4